MTRTWRLDTKRQTIAFAARGDGLPEVIWWGAPLPVEEDLDALAAAAEVDFTGGQLDAVAPLSLCPGAGGFPGQPGLVLHKVDGKPIRTDFRLADVVEAGTTLEFRGLDAAAGLGIRFHFAADTETGVIAAQSMLEAQVPVFVDWLAAPVLPGPGHSDEMLDFAGRWIGEFQPVRTSWSPGARMCESRTGRSGHETFPGLYMPGHGATNVEGEVWALHYGWSGGHRMVAEELPDGRRQVQFGHAFGAESAPGTHFETAPLFMAWSDTGLNGCAVAFQRHLRDSVVRWPDARPRPVHYNCWEAVYFGHKLDELKDIASLAARLGAERFVLDDGWFGRRDDDTSSLGDWVVDTRKYPDGLTPLIDHVRGLGMEFGLWVEPEMVSPDSDLYRAHPDWVLGPADQITGRGQLVLDMGRADVRDHLFAALSALLSNNAISYLKWDHNRVLPVVEADQARGTYDLLDRLRAAFPSVEIESCSSGGGRIDAGILSRTHRVWLSDSNDALERLRMQHEAALFLPAAITGSHVGPRQSHTSGRVFDISFRAWVAAQRHLGFEMDPRELTDDEAQVLKTVTCWWKDNRSWMMRADILRLDSADPAVIAEEQLAEDGSRFVVFAGNAGTSRQSAPRPLRLAGLDPQARYQVELTNRNEATHLSRAPLALKAGPLTLSGAALMGQGLRLPWNFPAHMWVIEGHRI